MIDALKSRATAALNHRDLAEIVAVIPAKDRGDPRMTASWLRAAASVEPRLADLPSFRAATGAVHAWGEGAALADRAAALYHSDALRAEFGPNEIEWAWRNPESAYRALLDEGASGRIKDRDLAREVMETIVGGRVLAQEHGLSWDNRAAAPAISSDVGEQNREYADLVSKDPRTLSSAEHTRLLALAGHRVDREERELQQAPQPAASDSEYRSLIARSLKGPLSPADEARLGQLATRRALDEGRLDPAEAFTDPSPAAPVRGRAPAPEPRVAAFDDAAAHARAVAAGVGNLYPKPQPAQPATEGTADSGAGEGA